CRCETEIVTCIRYDRLPQRRVQHRVGRRERDLDVRRPVTHDRDLQRRRTHRGLCPVLIAKLPEIHTADTGNERSLEAISARGEARTTLTRTNECGRCECTCRTPAHDELRAFRNLERRDLTDEMLRRALHVTRVYHVDRQFGQQQWIRRYCT